MGTRTEKGTRRTIRWWILAAVLAVAGLARAEVTITDVEVTVSGPGERLLTVLPEFPAGSYSYNASASYELDGEEQTEAVSGATEVEYAWGWGSATLVVGGHVRNVPPNNPDYRKLPHSAPPVARPVMNAVLGTLDL